MLQIQRAVLHHAGEHVCLKPPVDPLAGQLPQLLRDQAQDPVACLKAERLIDEFEILHIGADQVVFLIWVPAQDLTDPLIEKRLAVQPGEPVVLHLVHQRRRLPQGDDAGGPVEHHPGLIGLGDEVRRAHGQRLNLVLLAAPAGQDDDGDGGEDVVRAELFHKGVPIHDGHPDIQKDQGDVVLAQIEKIQGLLTVGGLQRVVVRRQDLAEYSAAGQIVLYDQNAALCPHCECSSCLRGRRYASVLLRKRTDKSFIFTLYSNPAGNAIFSAQTGAKRPAALLRWETAAGQNGFSRRYSSHFRHPAELRCTPSVVHSAGSVPSAPVTAEAGSRNTQSVFSASSSRSPLNRRMRSLLT